MVESEMSEYTVKSNDGNDLRRRGGALLVAAAVLLAVIGQPTISRAQMAIESFADTLYTDTVRVPDGGYDAGDTIWVGIGIDNDTAAVGALDVRVAIRDTTFIKPFEIPDPPLTYVPTRLTTRAINNGFDNPTVVFSPQMAYVGDSAIISVLMYDFQTDSTQPIASLPIGKGTVFELAIEAKAGITKGSSASIQVKDGSGAFGDPFQRRNNISYVDGAVTVYPRLRSSLILFGTDQPPPEDTTNRAPTIAFDPTTTNYNVQQGEQVAFSVTATDPDTTNDLVTLSATIPAGATFSPSNPVTGTVTTSGDFEWIPNFSQEGTFAVVFTASDDKGKSSTRTVNITVEKRLVDILFTSSSFTATPRGGIPGKRGVMLPIDVLATRVIYGIQFDVVLDRAAFRVDSLIPTDKLAGFTIWDNLDKDPDTVRVVAFSVAGDSIPLGGMSTIIDFAVTVDSNAVASRYPVTFANAVEAVTPDPLVPSIAMSVQNGVLLVDRLGDVNLDTLVNVADMVGLTSFILGSYPLNERQFDAADVNVDTAANVIDLVAIINAVLGTEPLTVSPNPIYAGGQAELQLAYAGMEGDHAIFYLEGKMPTAVAGMEISLGWDNELVTPDAGFEVQSEADGLEFRTDYSVVRRTDELKVVAYYDAKVSSAIPAGQGRYLKIPVMVRQPWTDMDNPPLRIKSVVLSDPDAAKVEVKGFGGGEPIVPTAYALEQNYPNPFNPSTTIAFTVYGAAAAGEYVSLTVYNVLGQKVVTLLDEPMAAGRHEVRWDGRTASGQRAASGLYFYRLVAGEYRETRKMLLLK